MNRVYPRAHGGDVFYASKATGVPVNGIIDFSASINPLGPSPEAMTAAREALRMVRHYPEPGAERLAEEIAGTLGISSVQVIPGKGSTELIYLLARAVKPRTVLVHNPTFSEYERAARLSGGKVKAVAGQKQKLSFDFARFAGAMRGADMAFLCNPNNPTGEVLEREAVLELAREAKKTRCLLVIDEAFIDFCPGRSVIEEAARGRNRYLVALRSMTKFHALTGLRVGYGVLGSAGLAARMLEFKEPWSVNLPAAEAAMRALKDSEHAQKSLMFMENERAYVSGRLERSGIWRCGPKGADCRSGPNFFLVGLPGARRFTEALFRKGVLVRDCTNFKGINLYKGGIGRYAAARREGDGLIRFAVRRRRENRMLLDEMDRWMRQGRL